VCARDRTVEIARKGAAGGGVVKSQSAVSPV